jgi:periplasmic copper chaperone A
VSFLMQRTTGRRTRLAVAGVLASLAMVAASCGSDPDATGDEESTVEITGAWARTSPMAADRGAAYMEFQSADGDRLVSASVDASIAGSVEIHETVAVGVDPDGDGMDGDDSGSMDQAMMMRELADGLELPAGEVVTLAPGGLHLMFLDLPEPLEAGESFELVLEFEKAGTRTLSVEILDAAP